MQATKSDSVRARDPTGSVYLLVFVEQLSWA